MQATREEVRSVVTVACAPLILDLLLADETGMPLQHCPGKRVSVRGQKHVHVVNSGNKQC